MRCDNRPEGDSLTAGQERSVKAAGLKKQIPNRRGVSTRRRTVGGRATDRDVKKRFPSSKRIFSVNYTLQSVLIRLLTFL